MRISLSPENIAFLQSQVDAGLYSSIDEALNRQLELIRSSGQDVSWAKPYIDEALEAEVRDELAPLDVESIRKKLHAAHADLVDGEGPSN